MVSCSYMPFACRVGSPVKCEGQRVGTVVGCSRVGSQYLVSMKMDEDVARRMFSNQSPTGYSFSVETEKGDDDGMLPSEAGSGADTQP